LSDKWQKREKLPQFANNQDAASANESVNESEDELVRILQMVKHKR